MKHVNRMGKTYYVFQGATKTGKPKYYVSLKAESDSGEQVEVLPDDFELFEDPTDARVSIRRKAPSDINEFELEFVRDRIETMERGMMTRVVSKGQFILIYESLNTQQFDSFAKKMDGLPSFAVRMMQTTSQMSPAFRCKLIGKKERIFEAYRYCSRGRIDDWISLHHDGPLDELCETFLRHLGQESFYELM